MTIRASCGHVLTDAEDLGKSVAWKGTSHKGTPAVVYGSLCDKCYFDYGVAGELLFTAVDEMKYMEDGE